MAYPKLIDLLKDNFVKFRYYRDGNLYYCVNKDFTDYIFPVPISDIGNATFLDKDRAILFQRYIRKAMEEQTLVTDNASREH